MSKVTVQNDRYTVEPLYQWDVNQVLEIRGLSLPSIPSIHFTNEAMDRAIVRVAAMDGAGVVTVDIPNSLLQKPYKIKAYVCIYEGETFETLYKIEIPIIARKKPADYTIEGDDDEIYSFNQLESLVYNSVASAESNVNSRCEQAEQKTEDAINTFNETCYRLQSAVDTVEGIDEMKTDIDEMKTDIDELKDLSTDFNNDIAALMDLSIESASDPGCFYRKVNGVTEWINPPMLDGVEYRTTERHNEKPVYIIQKSLETSTVLSYVEYGLGQSQNRQAFTILSINGVLSGNNDEFLDAVPFPAINSQGNIIATADVGMRYDRDNYYSWGIVVQTLKESAENCIARVTVKYTKSEV